MDTKVTAVVVTFNRLELLKRTIGSLRSQTAPLTGIIVVNNGSTDGTREWLDEQEGLTVIHQGNTGGAGGFSSGMRLAAEKGAEWIWCMDDDVFPRADCLATLTRHTGDRRIGILAPRRIRDGKVYTNDFTGYNLTNPFASMYKGKLNKMAVNGPVEIAGTAFEGLFVRREVTDKIGLPNKELFIFCDDTDYCLRTVNAGYKIVYIPDALIDKQLFFQNDTWTERNKKKKWKRFYQIRNAAYLNHHYGHNAGVRYLRSFIGVTGYILTVLCTAPFSDAYKLSDIPRLWKAYTDGINEELGRM